MVITEERYRLLSPPDGQCNDHVTLTYFKSYSRESCLIECETQFSIIKCGCKAEYMPGSTRTCMKLFIFWYLININSNKSIVTVQYLVNVWSITFKNPILDIQDHIFLVYTMSAIFFNLGCFQYQTLFHLPKWHNSLLCESLIHFFSPISHCQQVCHILRCFRAHIF